MLTGGIKRLPVAEEVLASGVDLVGTGTALAVDPDLPRTWRDTDATAVVTVPQAKLGNKAL